MLQPGAEVIHSLGGLQKFTGWTGPMFTDSGGFQIFSLGHGSVADEIKGRKSSKNPSSMLKITEEGALFRSYINGKKYALTPETSITIQNKLGADLIVCLDECTPFHVDKEYTAQSMRLSHRWEKRSLDTFKKLETTQQALYGIVQGGIHKDLRIESTDFVNAHDFFATAIGGSLGAHKDQMYEIVDFTMQNLMPSRPVHLLGIGGIQDIFAGIKMGIDTFDCVHPTRLARHGGALVKGQVKEHINLMNAHYKLNPDPIDKECPCHTCQTYSTGYLHHLLKAKELLAHSLITEHNVTYMNRLMASIRENLLQEESIDQLEKEWLPS
jgi:queuine tRNA-ribosyltransferase